MLNFMIGGLYTLIVICIAGFVGFLIGTKEFKKLVDDIIQKKKNPPVMSGPVKQLTPQQIKNDKNEEGKRIRELLKDDLPEL